MIAKLFLRPLPAGVPFNVPRDGPVRPPPVDPRDRLAALDPRAFVGR